MNDLISRKALIAEYDRAHIGEPGKARKLMEDAPAVQQWIPVTERLPEKEQDVLVADNGFIAVWTFYGDYWEDSHGWWQEFDEVTHWMPLPEPPKGE